MSPLAAVDLDLIEARAAAATPGPWFPKNDSEYSYGVTYREDPTKQVFESGERLIADCAFSDEEHNNYIFIAHARTDVSALINRVRELEAALDRVAELLGGAMERAVDAEATIERAKSRSDIAGIASIGARRERGVGFDEPEGASGVSTTIDTTTDPLQTAKGNVREGS